jgi:hypothetical protein
MPGMSVIKNIMQRRRENVRKERKRKNNKRRMLWEIQRNLH